MKILVSITPLFIIFVNSCNKNIDNDVRKFVETPIVIPYDRLDKRICSHFTDTITDLKEYRLICYLDSSQCQTCRFSQLSKIERQYIDLSEYNRLEFIYIFNIGIEETEDLYRVLCRSKIQGTVYLDTCNAFLKANPHIPESELFHTFVINNQGKVLMVGDPFKNEKMEALLKKVISNEQKAKK